MVEPVLYASLGALVATLLGLMFLPFFWRRAISLTTKQLVGRLPISASEIVAAQDRLRAEQAMTMRVVERKAERAVSEATRDRVDAARARSTELGHLADLADLRAQVVALQSEGARVKVERDRQGAEAASAYDALAAARSTAETASRDLQNARQEASAARSAAEQARNESASRTAEIGSLRARLEAFEQLAAEQPRGADGRPRLPRADNKFAAGDAGEANLPALRAKLDEVADQILRATQGPKAADTTPAARPAKAASKRMQVMSAGSLPQNAEV